MQFKNIKTEKQFWNLAENWYQRTHRLREIWQNSKETETRKSKALRLHLIMVHRMLTITRVATFLQQIKSARKTYPYQKGGIINATGIEEIIPRDINK